MFFFVKILANPLKMLRVQSWTMSGELVNYFLHIVLETTTCSHSLFRQKNADFPNAFCTLEHHAAWFQSPKLGRHTSEHDYVQRFICNSYFLFVIAQLIIYKVHVWLFDWRDSSHLSHLHCWFIRVTEGLCRKWKLFLLQKKRAGNRGLFRKKPLILPDSYLSLMYYSIHNPKMRKRFFFFVCVCILLGRI